MNLIVDGVLGSGTYGRVYSCTYKKRKVAVKEISLICKGDPFPCLQEAVFSSSIHHPYLTEAECYVEGDKMYLVQDIADKDASSIAGTIDISDMRRYTHQLLQAVHCLHSHNILHGDIKPSNVLVYGDFLRLCDYSLSRLLPTEWNDCLYTANYRPPEVWLGKKVTLAADIWALGCTLAEMAMKYPVFAPQSSESPSKYLSALYQWQVNGPFLQDKKYIPPPELHHDYTPPYFKAWTAIMDEDFLRILGSMLRVNPATRPTAKELLQDPWFEGLEVKEYVYYYMKEKNTSAASNWIREQIKRGIRKWPVHCTIEEIRREAVASRFCFL